jgi:hypothetical protein
VFEESDGDLMGDGVNIAARLNWDGGNVAAIVGVGAVDAGSCS